MKVGINARLLSAPTLRGWSRYTINLLRELPAQGAELFLYTDQPLHQNHVDQLPRQSYQIRLAPEMRYTLWEQYWLPRRCAADGVDVFHTPFNFGLPWSTQCPRILTLHDAIGQVDSIPFGRQRWSRDFFQSGLRHWVSRTRADKVITPSEYSRGDLVKHLGIENDKIVVIPEAADARFHESISETQRAAIRARYRLVRPYIFYVGGWEERKNIPFLLRAFSAAGLGGLELVLAGGLDEQRAGLSSLAASLNVADRVRLLGWVDDADLPALYSEALCFVYPSKYEGFGLQLCEAMAVGCPTLAASATCLPEVLGAGGETFRIDSSDELSNLLRRICDEEEFRARLSRRASSRSKEFSWHRTAVETMKVYTDIIATA